jgi:hypothetical protein
MAHEWGDPHEVLVKSYVYQRSNQLEAARG